MDLFHLFEAPFLPISFLQSEKPFLIWLIQCFSLASWLALSLDLLLFIGAWWLIAKTKCTKVLAAYLLLVPIPVFIAIYAMLYEFVSIFGVVSVTGVSLSEQQVFAGIIEPIAGFFATTLPIAPTYLSVSVVLLYRVWKQRVK